MMKKTFPSSIPTEANSLQNLIAYSAIGRMTVGLLMGAWLVFQGTGIAWAEGGMSLVLLAGFAISWEPWKAAWKSATNRQRGWLAVITLAQVLFLTLVLAGVTLACLSRLQNKSLAFQLWFPFH